MLVAITDNFLRLKGILERNIADTNVGDRTSSEYLIANLTLHQSQAAVGVWVDNADDPHVLLVLSVGRFGTLNETYCFVNSMFVDTEHRSPRVTKELLATITLYAQAKQCDAVYGSSWTYRGATDVSAVWAAYGAEPQETLFVKHLK